MLLAYWDFRGERPARRLPFAGLARPDASPGPPARAAAGGALFLPRVSTVRGLTGAPRVLD